MNATSNALTPTADGFDLAASDPNASPLQGVGKRFKDGGFYAFGDETDEREQTYAVIDRRNGWQKLERDCPPEYAMQMPGQPKPPQPHVPKEAWPKDLNGNPAHPWKWATYVYLLNTSTGELSTFWTNTVGGHIAVKDMSEQITLMRRMKPNAIPIVALESLDMPTSYGGTKPRPHFKICGWRTRESVGPPQAALAAPEQEEAAKASGGAPFNDSVPFVPEWR
jgi:hypothetical protein